MDTSFQWLSRSTCQRLLGWATPWTRGLGRSSSCATVSIFSGLALVSFAFVASPSLPSHPSSLLNLAHPTLPHLITMAPKSTVSEKKPASTSTASKAPGKKPAGKAPAKKAVKKTPAADGEKKKKRKTRKET